MKNQRSEVAVVNKETLPGQYKRVAALILDKTAKRAYINAMVDAETTYQYNKKHTSKERKEAQV